MEFGDVVRRRRMVRSYRPHPVADDSLRRIIAAGLRAPSAGHTQGVRLAVVTSAGMRERIARAAGEEQWTGRGHPAWLSTAPVHLVLGVRIGDYHSRYAEPDKGSSMPPEEWPVPYWWLDAGAALEAILLATVAEGLGAGFLGAHAIPNLASLVDWTDVTAVGVVTVGHGDEQPVVGSAIDRPRRTDRVTWHRE